MRTKFSTKAWRFVAGKIRAPVEQYVLLYRSTAKKFFFLFGPVRKPTTASLCMKGSLRGLKQNYYFLANRIRTSLKLIQLVMNLRFPGVDLS